MTLISRRQALTGAAVAASAAIATPLMPTKVSAAAPLAGGQAPGFYRRKVGNAEVTALLDGYLDIAHNLWVGIEEADVKQAIADSFLPDNGNIRIGITSYLVNTGDRLILVDSGSAELFGPTAGKFLEMLAAAGHSADQIDDILITHMHPDHIGALITADGKATFANAQVHVAQKEIEFWASETNLASAPDFAKPWYQAALDVKAAYDGRLNIFSGAPELITGVTAMELHGHTPGQTGYHFGFDGDELLIWGDACGVAAVQFQHPEAGLVFDVDGETGKKTRAKLLDMAAHDKLLVASPHCPFPSFGHVARSGDAYAWVPDEYRYTV
jgi:glyoxylase-like metal-dependent hydrolase (beta-lactamase superfamily II)